MKWWNRLSVRLTVTLLLLAIVPLAGFGIATVRDILRLQLQSVSSLHKEVAFHSAKTIQDALADITGEIQLVCDTVDITSVDQVDQELYLQMIMKASPHISHLTIATRNGEELVKVGRDTVYFKQDLETHHDHPEFPKHEELHSVIGQLHEDSNNLLILDLYIPLVDPVRQEPLAVVAAEIDMEKLLTFITDIRVGETGYVYVVNAEGKIVVHPDHSAVLAGEDALINPLVQDFISGGKEPGTNERYVNRHQQEVISNGFALREPKLMVVVAQPVTEALTTVTLVRERQIAVLLIVITLAICLALYFTIKLVRPLRLLETGAQLIGAGNLLHRIHVNSSDEMGLVTQSFNAMAEELEIKSREVEEQNWLRLGIAELDVLLRGDQSLDNLCTQVVTFMATYLQQQVGLMYVLDSEDVYRYAAGYAFQPGAGFSATIMKGDGLVGQAVQAMGIIEIFDVPDGYVTITSGLGAMAPKHLSIVPFVFNSQVEAVMELGSLARLTDRQKLFIQGTSDAIAIILASARGRHELHAALIQTRLQAEKLHRQQEELQTSNEEMEEQTQLLMASEGKLKEQQEELKAANEELEEKTEYLERNKKNIERKNQVLEELRLQLEKKAEDVAVASKYKSQFLANMSHELRTPLNSLLLLARLLADNKEGNLLDDQVESAEIIYRSGSDLLSLINEVLDLSRIEAGKMELRMAEITLLELQDSLSRNFRPVAAEKDLSFTVSVRDNCPATIVSDRLRLEQVLRNFLANAFKFTSRGGVEVEMYSPDDSAVFVRSGLTSLNTIAIDVRDTGTGIPQSKKEVIFEAFQQGEGGTARKYGGTGLGLTISRELANLLGGEIQLQSEENAGSTFTLFLPKEAGSSGSAWSPQEGNSSVQLTDTLDGVVLPERQKNTIIPTQTVADDRDSLSADDKTVLIIEDDVNFATTLLLFCRDRGFKGLVSLTGEDGLLLAEKYQPKAIILDIHLPGIDGWGVLEALKEGAATRHIPVHFMSAENIVPAAFSKGAVGFVTKPVGREELEQAIDNLESIIDKKMKDLLLVENDKDQRQAINRLINGSDVMIRSVASGNEAKVALRQKKYDCMIMDLGLPDMSGFELLEDIEKDQSIILPPIIVYTGKDLTKEEENELRHYAESIIIKGVRSEERLLDEASLFLHRMVEKMSEEKRQMLTLLHDGDQNLRDRTILLVDDDMRNVFALSKVLHDKGIKTLKAENGIKALEMLEKREDVDLVLMDVMMPQLDGLQTMRRIRAQEKFSQLPIIALTAKAMQKDKDACIAAGANDYMTKPVEINRLLSMMRVWLYR